MKIPGIPTDKDLKTYPSVHLTSPHEWDPSALDYIYPEDIGEHNWIHDSTKNFQFDLPQISSTHTLLVNEHTTQWGVAFDFFSMKRHLKS